MAIVILRKRQKTLSYLQLSETHKIFKKVTHNKHPQAHFKSMSQTIKGEGKVKGGAGEKG